MGKQRDKVIALKLCTYYYYIREQREAIREKEYTTKEEEREKKQGERERTRIMS